MRLSFLVFFSSVPPRIYKKKLKASAGGHTDVVRLLLQAGAVPDSSTERDHRPLHLAAQYGHSPVIQVRCVRWSLLLSTVRSFGFISVYTVDFSLVVLWVAVLDGLGGGGGGGGGAGAGGGGSTWCVPGVGIRTYLVWFGGFDGGGGEVLYSRVVFVCCACTSRGWGCGQ